MHRCRTCQQDLPDELFGLQRRASKSLRTTCKSCDRDRVRRIRHGLTQFDKAEIASNQGGCAVCQTRDPGRAGWVVDHDHKCHAGEISCTFCRRGIVCQPCNMVLAYARDQADVLRRAADYLDAHDATSRNAVRNA